MNEEQNRNSCATNREIPRFALLLVLILAFSVVAAQEGSKLTADERQLASSISAQSMKGHLSFIASDALEGRDTPSRGLDIAAEYIAAQFRRAGLEPAGDDGYFQTSEYPNKQGENQGVQNVVGILRGSDPILRDTFVLVTAHYDHLGIKPTANGHNVYNGACDDGSGTVSVIELANAFATLPTHPKRSVVFMTFYGEEKGLIGSTFYGKHPIFPVDKTVADVNLEQVGRTDDVDGPRVLGASMTGYDYSDVGKIFTDAGKKVGVSVTKHKSFSDKFFAQSDNQALADLGIPAHTICTAFMYPDYHRVTDTWPKIDYDNMARVDQMVALGLYAIADSIEVPHWSALNQRAARYLKAWQRMHPDP